jgi:glucokinase
MNYRIGIDLGGTNIAAGLVDENNVIIAKTSCKTNLPQPREVIEASIAFLCTKLCEENGISLAKDIAWVGIGTPGNVDTKTGIVGFNANFDYHNWALVSAMEEQLSCKVYIENDANAAAYGEFLAGAAQNADCAIVLTLGTGIGGGIILNRKIFSGFNSAGAEIGHMVIVVDGRPCMCGRNGCWEKYASARALTEDTREALRLHPDNMMWNICEGSLDKVNAKTAFDGMRAGDKLAEELVENFAKYVACGMINIINIFQPEIICIGGGVSKEGDVLLNRLRKYIDAEEYARTAANRTQICTALLRNDAGIIGAANLGNMMQ